MPQGKPSPHPIEVVWEGGKRYRGGLPGGPTGVVDGDRSAAPSPVDSVLVALAACSAIDVVEILAKRRTPATSLAVRCDFSRAESPPRRLTDIHLRFEIATGSAREHVQHAVDLSVTKYCSVASSLAPDTKLTWSLELKAPSAERPA